MNDKSRSALFALLGACSLIACGSAASSSGNGESNSADVVAADCSSKIEAAVLKQARELNEEATVVGRTVLYGDDDAYADAVLVRVSDETEPSDYLVVRSRLADGVVVPSACELEDVRMVATGVVPADDELAGGPLSPTCASAIEQAVVAQAQEINETAHVTGMKLLYGDTTWAQGIALVRVSDDTEPSDYVAVYETEGPGRGGARCKVELVKNVDSGMLPDVPGLKKVVSCIAPDDRVLADGDSFPMACNTCTCTDRGIVCTELACP